ncbi:hypothetical protein Tsubulata_006234 [Turnera subulata]|uniref:EamA domain-containing protein n=1 Tax=Turnera subulata TaxID=218843 RepID=A0A9Q0J995_9ROSI|nr:hypothetical protein Tsubulata_006234 [Turnera subulata]
MGGWDDLKPAMAMFGLQLTYAGVNLFGRAALLQGMSPRVFVVYRQAVATMFLAPIAYVSSVTINQNFFFEGVYLASSSIASAMGNLVPAITFVMAFFFGMEKVDLRSIRSVAKIIGTLICVSGAMSMALLRGPKVLNASILGDESWFLGCLFLFASSCCWSSWLVLQVPATNSCPDHLSLSAWMCFFGTIQSALVTVFIEQNPDHWKLHSYLEVFCCLYAGIIGSGMSFFVQAWCISLKGPLFPAMFNPLCTLNWSSGCDYWVVCCAMGQSKGLHKEIMGGWDDLKPVMAMIGLQFTYAGIDLISRAALLQGMSPRIFVVYRQAIATLFLAPIAYFSRYCDDQSEFILRGYILSLSIRSKCNGESNPCNYICNGILFWVDIRSMRSVAKILGTLICVSGAMSMALLRGPKLLNASNLGDENWLLGCILLFASSCCWSSWLVLQDSTKVDEAEVHEKLEIDQAQAVKIYIDKSADDRRIVDNNDLEEPLLSGRSNDHAGGENSKNMGGYRPAMAMIGLQFLYSGVALFTRVALLHGLSPRIFVVYRQGSAALIMTPLAYISRRRSSCPSPLGLRGFAWIFVASLIGVTANQNAYFQGLYLSSSTAASAMTNLIPAITFVMATVCGFEKVNIRSMRSIAKILGTLVCVSGAISMALLKGPKLLNMELVPISKACPDHLYSSALMCCFATLQSIAVALFTEHDLADWVPNGHLEILCCLYGGIALAVSFFVQAWVISHRGPLFSALFNPLCTVIVTFFAAVFLREETYTGSLVGALAVIIGLYVVLWGKAKDLEDIKPEIHQKQQLDQSAVVQVTVDESFETKTSKLDLEEPLLSPGSTNVDEHNLSP